MRFYVTSRSRLQIVLFMIILVYVKLGDLDLGERIYSDHLMNNREQYFRFLSLCDEVGCRLRRRRLLFFFSFALIF